MNWQPIETAPREAAFLLLAVPNGRRGPSVPSLMVVIGGWSGFFGEWCDDSGDVLDSGPTHWMPLPEPPKDAHR